MGIIDWSYPARETYTGAYGSLLIDLDWLRRRHRPTPQQGLVDWCKLTRKTSYTAAYRPRPLLPDPNGQERRRTPQHTWALLTDFTQLETIDLDWIRRRHTPQHTWALLTDLTQLERRHTPEHINLCWMLLSRKEDVIHHSIYGPCWLMLTGKKDVIHRSIRGLCWLILPS